MTEDPIACHGVAGAAGPGQRLGQRRDFGRGSPSASSASLALSLSPAISASIIARPDMSGPYTQRT